MPVPDQSEAEMREYLRRYLRILGLMPGSLCVPDMIKAAIGFYRDVRFTRLAASADADMLLYQWGTFDFGQGPSFRINVTRQFIGSGAKDDDALSQLNCIAHFVPSAALTAIPTSNRWCNRPAELPEFEAYIMASPAIGP